MRRIPEQRNRLGKDETILDVPIDFLAHLLPDSQLIAKESSQCSTCFCHMDIGNFVEGHEDRRKQGVHQHTDTKCDKELAPAETEAHTCLPPQATCVPSYYVVSVGDWSPCSHDII